jgi:ribosome-interacting GTPase 1
MMNHSIFLDLLESIRLCVVGLVVIVISLVTDERKSGNTDVVEGRIVAAVISLHPRLKQVQICERRQSGIDWDEPTQIIEFGAFLFSITYALFINAGV